MTASETHKLQLQCGVSIGSLLSCVHWKGIILCITSFVNLVGFDLSNDDGLNLNQLLIGSAMFEAIIKCRFLIETLTCQNNFFSSIVFKVMLYNKIPLVNVS